MSEWLDQQFMLLDRFLQETGGPVVDLGAGLGRHAAQCLENGIAVVALDHSLTPDLLAVVRRFPGRCRLASADVTSLPLADGSVEALWASHCLEHMTDPLRVLGEWRRVLRPDGVLGIVVPPFKTEVVGRHVFTGWSVGQLMLTLLRTGFDVRSGSYAREGYNVCAIVRPSADPPRLSANDEILCRHHERFPAEIEARILENRRQNTFGDTISFFEGNIRRLNW